MRRRSKVMNLFIIGVLSLTLLLGAPLIVMATVGPQGSPPGGYTITNDTDPGNGEKWGRAGGREITFSGIQLSLFDELWWGLASGSGVGIAFDGAIDAPGETLIHDTGESNFASGIAVWTGQTQVEVSNGTSYSWQTIDTKFILTVTDSSGNPVTLTTAYLGLPLADLTNLTPSLSGEVFLAKLEMQAKNLPSQYADYPTVPAGTFGPALDIFDALRTQPSAAEHAITKFNWGFFYELADTFTLAQHDEHITGVIDILEAKADGLSADVGFIYEEWSPVTQGFRDDHAAIQGGISALEVKLDTQGSVLDNVNSNTEGLSGIQGGISALEVKLDTQGSVLDNVNFNTEGLSQTMQGLSNDVGQVSQQQNQVVEQVGNLPNLNILLLLFGIETGEVGMPPDPDLPPFSFITGVSDLYQSLGALEAKLDALESTSKVDVQVISTQDKQQFLILTTEAGQPVSAQLVSIQALTAKGKNPVEIQDVTADTTSVAVGSGILDVTVDLPKSAKDAEVFVFTVEHNGVYGAIMIDKKGDNAGD